MDKIQCLIPLDTQNPMTLQCNSITTELYNMIAGSFIASLYNMIAKYWNLQGFLLA